MSSHVEQLYQVSGLWCSSCARALQHALGRLPGVDRCSVDFVTHTVKLSLGKVDGFESVQALAKGMGYRIEPYRDLANLRQELTARMRGELMRLAWVGFFAVWTMALALVEYTMVMGPLSESEFRWLALAMGTLSVTGIFGGAWKVYLIGLNGLIRGRPSIDSLLVVTSLACLILSFASLASGSREVFFDSAIMVIAVVLAIRAVLATVSGRQLDSLYRSLQQGDPEVRVVEDGSESLKPVNVVQPGYRVRVCLGELISVDGTVVRGSGAAQSALLTGEADPVPLSRGSMVVAGQILLNGEIWIEVESYFGDRCIDRLGKQALSSFHQDNDHGFVDTVLSKSATVLLLLASASLIWRVSQGASWTVALPQALSVMIVACPCALFFCRPLPLIRAQFLAQRSGLVLLRPWRLFRLNRVRTVAFDKTGTLTSRAPDIELLSNSSEFSDSALWGILAGAELNVQHPIAYAVLNEAARYDVAPARVSERRIEGKGVRFRYNGKRWSFGQSRPESEEGLCLLEGDSGDCVARFAVANEAGTQVSELVSCMGERYRTVLLSGDRTERVEEFGSKLGFDSVYGNLDQAQKAMTVSEISREWGSVLYCGDGYNDIQALKEAEVSLCMPHSPAAVRLASDVQLLRCDADAFGGLFQLGGLVEKRYRQNVIFALTYNAVTIPSALMGGFAPWVAAAGMGFATLSVLLNSLR